jgi:protein TonB
VFGIKKSYRAYPKRRNFIIGLFVSLLVHASFAWVGEIAGHHPPAVIRKVQEPAIALIEMPKIEPDEPEVQDQSDQPQAPADFAPPMQVDVPSIVTDASFVQKLEPPPPDNISTSGSVITIPQNTGSWRAGIGQIFDISKLDQIPVVVVQQKPMYPFEMRRAGISGAVTVDFIVDTEGNVRQAIAVSSTQVEFEQAAVQAVSKWRFRPGKKAGHTVNSHMQVPIAFSLD